MKHSSDVSLRILAVDIGGTGLKAAVIDCDGNLVTPPARIPTPHPCAPALLVENIGKLGDQLGAENYQAVSVGFPGILRRGIIVTAPTLDTPELLDFDLVGALAQRLGKPVRALNDASMQGFGSIEGQGLEMIITLGTGMGAALFRDGAFAAQLELSTHPFRHGETYNEQLGNHALKRIGKKKWNGRVEKAIEVLRNLAQFDRLYIGGGNSKNLTFTLPDDTRIVANENGLRGGARLWTQPAEADKANVDQGPAPAPKRRVRAKK